MTTAFVLDMAKKNLDSKEIESISSEDDCDGEQALSDDHGRRNPASLTRNWFKLTNKRRTNAGPNGENNCKIPERAVHG